MCFATKLSKKAENRNGNGTNYLKLLHKLFYFTSAFCSEAADTYNTFPMKTHWKRAQKRVPTYISAHFDRLHKDKKGRPARGRPL